MENTTFLPSALLISITEQADNFFNSADAGLLSRNLRRLFIDSLKHELKTGVPVYFDEFLFPFNCLLDFLDAVQDLHNPSYAEEENDEKNEENNNLCKNDSIDKTKPKEKSKENNNDNDQTMEINQENYFKLSEKFMLLSTQQRIIEFIVATINPEKIFLLHHIESNNENEREFFDFLIVIPNTSKKSFKAYEEILSITSLQECEIHFSLHHSSLIHKQLEEGHVFYSLVCNNKNLVYDNCKVPLIETGKDKLDEVKKISRTIFEVGMKRAESFLSGAKVYQESCEKEMSAFMLHQSAELSLRSLILALSGHEIKSHYFLDLLKNCKRYAPQIKYLFSKDAAEEERLMFLLEKAYLQARYDHEFEIAESDLTLIMKQTESLLELISKAFDDFIAA